MDQFYLLVFNNTQGAIKGESYLKSQGVKVTIMPTPTRITRSCGISLRISIVEVEKVKILLAKGEIDYKGLYEGKSGQYLELL